MVFLEIGKFMRFSLKIIILSCIFFILTPALLLLSYADYSNAKRALENNFNFMIEQTAENIIGAYDLVEVSYRILSLSLENEMEKAFVPFINSYNKAEGIVANIDLTRLKSQLGEEYDLYIIDANGVIIHTTFAKDQNLDFSKVAPDFNKKLQNIRKESRYQGDRISSETVTGNVRKYAYWGTPDKKYILEIGIKSSQFEAALKNLDLLKISADFEEFNPELNSVIVFNGNGKVSNKPDFVTTDSQIKNIKHSFKTGDRVDFNKYQNSERWIYIKADVEEEDGAASQGDKVIEMVFDTSKLENKLRDLAQNQISLAIIFIIAGGIISIVLANRIAKPISRITDAVRNITGGDLNQNIPMSNSSREVENLSIGISKMTKSIKDKISDIEKINTSYERFVPKEFLTLLDKKLITDVDVGDNKSLKMSVLFSDMRNFTSISEQLTPTQNFEFLNNYLNSLAPAIKSNDGFIDKYIGDGVMALFPNKADDPVNAAIEMNLGLEKLNVEFKKKGIDKVSMGVGIHRGDLILGTIGQTERMETTVISDTVNVSSRLESLNKKYGTSILISGSIMESISLELKSLCRLIDKVQVKGKSEFIEVYEVFGGDDDEIRNMKINTKTKFDLFISNALDNKVSEAVDMLKFKSLDMKKDAVLSYWHDRLSAAANNP